MASCRAGAARLSTRMGTTRARQIQSLLGDTDGRPHEKGAARKKATLRFLLHRSALAGILTFLQFGAEFNNSYDLLRTKSVLCADRLDFFPILWPLVPVNILGKFLVLH
jgi:hypothetical protein